MEDKCYPREDKCYSTYRGYNPSYQFIKRFIGFLSPFITGRGPPCSVSMEVGL